MKENYNIYIAKSTLQNYIQPQHFGTKEAKQYHYPAQIHLVVVRKNKMSDHVNEYYCLTLVKGVKIFASAFLQNVILISQDDKAKVYIYYYFIEILIVRTNRFF